MNIEKIKKDWEQHCEEYGLIGKCKFSGAYDPTDGDYIFQGETLYALRESDCEFQDCLFYFPTIYFRYLWQDMKWTLQNPEFNDNDRDVTNEVVKTFYEKLIQEHGNDE